MKNMPNTRRIRGQKYHYPFLILFCFVKHFILVSMTVDCDSYYGDLSSDIIC